NLWQISGFVCEVFLCPRGYDFFHSNDSPAHSVPPIALMRHVKIKKNLPYIVSEYFMETVTNSSVILDGSAPARRAGMSESEWREAIKFDSTDTGWVIMSIG